jgi:hypothetical protein
VKEITGWSAKFNGYFRYAYRIEIDPEMFFYCILVRCIALMLCSGCIYLSLFFFVFFLMICVDAVC